MKISPSTRRLMEHPRLTTRLFPPPPPPLPPISSQPKSEPDIVDLRDREEQKKLCEDAKPFAPEPMEPLWQTVLGCLILAALFVLVLFLL